MSRCEYQTSRFFIPAKPAIAVRYSSTVSRTTRSCSAPRNPLSRAAISMLAAQPLDVPLPRARERLVEVVDVEDQPPLGRGEDAEVRQVRVPATLHREARARRRAQVLGHDQRRPAIERERRHEHAPVADRHQLRHTGLRLALEQRRPDRPGAAGGSNVACSARGTSLRAALPRATRSATDRCGVGARGVSACASCGATVRGRPGPCRGRHCLGAPVRRGARRALWRAPCRRPRSRVPRSSPHGSAPCRAAPARATCR